MAYVKQTWSCGDVVTDERMNHIEQGIADAHECCGGNTIFIHQVGTGTCQGNGYVEFDISYQEIVDGLAEGASFWLVDPNNNCSEVITIYPRLLELEGYYSVYIVDMFAIIYDPGTDSMIDYHVTCFCNTATGHMRDTDCWAPV